MIPLEALMRLAIDKARAGVAAGQMPFGCAIARGDELLAAEHNTVAATVDCTAHAEVNALRAACRAAGSYSLPGAVVATTCEPCPMCTGALHWAGVEVVHFGASIDDAGAQEIAARARGTPRIANRLLRRVRDFAEVEHGGSITAPVAHDALNRMEVDRYGLDEIDRKMLDAKADQVDSLIKRLRAMSNGLRHAAKCPAPNHMACPSFQRLIRAASSGKLAR